MDILEEYTKGLFDLIDNEDNVSEFIALYTKTFNYEPSQALIENYQDSINGAPDNRYSDDDESYSYD